MPNMACQGWAAIQAASVCQLATRPESTPSVRVKRYSAEKERRSQYNWAKVGKIHQVSRAPAAATAARRARRIRRRLHHISTASATATLSREAREKESTSAAKNTAPPAARAVRDTGDSSISKGCSGMSEMLMANEEENVKNT